MTEMGRITLFPLLRHLQWCGKKWGLAPSRAGAEQDPRNWSPAQYLFPFSGILERNTDFR